MFSLRLADSADTSVCFSEAIAQWQLTEKQHLQYWGVIYFSTSDFSGSLTARSQGHKVQVLLQQIQNWLPELGDLHKIQATVPFQQGFPNWVGMATAIDNSLHVCTRPVTQRRWYASIPSSPFPKHNPSLLNARTAAHLIPTGYSRLPHLGSPTFPMLLRYLHKYSLLQLTF